MTDRAYKVLFVCTGNSARSILAEVLVEHPARDFALSLRFYADLGFQSRALTHDLVEMTLGSCAPFASELLREGVGR